MMFKLSLAHHWLETLTEIASVNGRVRRQTAGYPVDECYAND